MIGDPNKRINPGFHMAAEALGQHLERIHPHPRMAEHAHRKRADQHAEQSHQNTAEFLALCPFSHACLLPSFGMNRRSDPANGTA